MKAKKKLERVKLLLEEHKGLLKASTRSAIGVKDADQLSKELVAASKRRIALLNEINDIITED